MKLDTIEQQLIEKADTALRARIHKTTRDIDQLLRNGCGYSVKIVREDKSEVSAEWYKIIEALEAKAFSMHCEKEQQNAINGFLRKIENIQTAVEELGIAREQLEQ